LRSLDERDIGAGRLGGGIHGSKTRLMEWQLKVGGHVGAMVVRNAFKG